MLILTKLDAQSKGISENNHYLREVHESVTELTATKVEFERWRPKVDGQVADLRDCVDNLRQQLDELKSTSTPATPHHAHAGSASLKVPGSAHLVPSSPKAASGPIGHRDETHHRSDGSGVIYTLDPPPANGTKNGSPRPHPHSDFKFHHHTSCGSCSHMSPAMPQLDFPKFSGTSPKFWIKQCDTYFDLYEVPPENWVKLATINFTGTATFWMQTIELNLKKCT